jgi:hypothetical protein
VILLTVNDDAPSGRALGAAGHLVKPLIREPLLRMLAQVCPSLAEATPTPLRSQA